MFYQYFQQILQICDKQMRRTVRTNQPELQTPQIVNPDRAERVKFGVICLRNSFEGILKRVECQTLCKFIGQCGVYDKKVQKLKFICFFAQHFLRRKKQQALDKLKRTRQLKHMFFKAVNNLALICRRISKGHASFVFSQMRKNVPKLNVQLANQTVAQKSSRESFRGSRFSEQSVRSNILSVSEDSLGGSKVLIFDEGRDYTSQQVLAIRRQNEELKKMTLSSQARDCLMKMQRFDRYIYQMQSDRVLKEPITKELRRLQKMKNEYKQMRVKFYDNELTITCLFNHIKLVYEMNREIADGGTIKAKIGELEKKMQEMNSQHRKEINEYKKKLMFAGIGSGSKERSRENSVDVSMEDKGEDKVVSSFEFTSDQTTTFNILIAALRGKKYKDLRRQVDYFIKKSNKEQFIVLLKEVLVMVGDIESQNQADKLKQKDRSELLSSISLLEKGLRNDKLEDIDKLKIKSKSMPVLSQFYTLTETISSLYGDLKKLKKKQSSSAQKEFKSAQKDKFKKNIDLDNDQLQKQLKMLQIRYQQLENQKNRLEDSAKKQVKPLIPKRPSLEKDKNQGSDAKSEELIKKLQESEVTLTKKVEILQKENAQMYLKNQNLLQNLQKKVKDYQAELGKRIEQEKISKAKIRQFEQGCKYYSAIKAKRSQKQNYQRQINEFKRYFSQSIFLQIFETSIKEETSNQLLLNQIKSIGTLFSQSAWKRKQNILFTEEGEVYGYLNQIIELLLSLSKEKQENLKNSKESQRQFQLLKKRQLNMSEDNNKIREQLSKIREQNGKLKTDLRASKNQLQSSLKQKSLEKFTKLISSTSTNNQQSQIQGLQAENSRLKSQLEEVHSSIQQRNEESQINIESLIEEKREYASKAQQFEAATNLYNVVKTKIALKQPYQRELNDFKRKYPQSIFLQIFDTVINAESGNQAINTQLKTIIALFSDNSWKRKSNIMIKQEGEVFTFLNQLIEILLAFANERQENTKIIAQRNREIEGLRKKELGWSEDASNSREEATRAKEEIAKQKVELNKMRQELQSAQLEITSLNRKSTPEKQKPNAEITELRIQNERVKQEFESINQENRKLRQQIITLQNNITNLQQRKDIEPVKSETNLLSKLQQLNQWKVEAEQKEKRIIEQLRIKQSECEQNRQRVDELQYQLGSYEDRLNSYKLLHQKVKSQRDNLRLIIEEKNEQFETVKQDVEYHEQDKRLSEEKIIQLKHSYQSTELQIRKIELEVERLLRERDAYTQQRSDIQRNYQREVSQKEDQIKQLKIFIDQKQRICLELQGKLEVAIISHRNELIMKDNERQFLQKQLKFQQNENNQLKIRLQQESIDMKQRIDSLAKELQQSKQDQEQERTQMRYRIQEMNSLPIPTRELTIVDIEKQELRRQLELVNEELAGLVRNSQQEKRQLRKYIEQMANDMQMQSVLAGQEKKILREDIERARNEEYQIGHQKIRKLRQDIQVLREENERLTSIIDVNEANFHQLISEHQQMNIRIGEMNEQIEQSTAQLAHAHQQRQNLVRRLQPLQDKLTQFQEKIAQAMHERMQSEQQYMQKSQAKTGELELIINQLQEQNQSLLAERNHLQITNTQQGRDLIDMHHHIINMEAEINSYQMAGSSINQVQPKEKEGAYAQYLQEKLKIQEDQLKRHAETERELLNRVDRLMKSNNDTERERLEQLTFRRDKQIQIAFMQNNYNSQIGILNERCRKNEEIVSQKTKQIEFWKMQASSAKQETSIVEERLRNAEQTTQITQIQNGRLRAQLEDLMRQKSTRSIKQDEAQRLTVQNRMLTTKLSDYRKQQQEWERRINEYEVEFSKIRRSLESKSDSLGGQMEWFKDRGVAIQREEQLQWLRGQIQIRDQQINRLRSLQISFAALTSENQQILYKLRESEQKYIRQANLSKEISRQLTIQEENYKLEITSLRNREQHTARRYAQANSQLESLRQQNRHLSDINEEIQRSSAALGIKLSKETGWLKEIVRQLGGQYQQGEQEEIQIKILMKISEEIGELIEGNKQLRFRCGQLQIQVRDHHAEDCEQQFILALQQMVANVLSYLKQQELINPQQAFPPAQVLLSVKSSHKLILDVGIFFRDLIISSINQQEETNTKYTDIINEIKKVIDEYLLTGKRETLTGLQKLLITP